MKSQSNTYSLNESAHKYGICGRSVLQECKGNFFIFFLNSSGTCNNIQLGLNKNIGKDVGLRAPPAPDTPFPP